MKQSTCGYLYRDGSCLMLLRNRKKNDVNHDKWIGVGGKFESGEDARTCMKREIKEETGYIADKLQYEGIIYFDYPHKECEKIWIYTCSQFHGEQIICDEGTLAWIPEEKIMDLSLWEGDRIFLQKMLKHENEPFCFELKYDEHDTLVSCVERKAQQE